MRYGSVQNVEFHLFCSENRNFFIKMLKNEIIGFQYDKMCYLCRVIVFYKLINRYETSN